MLNIFDYLTWRGDLSLRQAAFNNVDNAILCRVSYIPLDGIVAEKGIPITIAEAADLFFSATGDKKMALKSQVTMKDDIKLLAALADSKRFNQMYLSHYVNKIDLLKQEQFSALTILTGDGSAYIAFRGTDNTLVGWKEDFNMSFLTPIPAQEEAVGYLSDAAADIAGKIRIGGHSKGGNLAVYAAAFCGKVMQRRIIGVYNNDGPGFDTKIISSKAYDGISDKVHTFVPQSSIVGMLLEHEEDYTVIHSKQIGLLQHDLYSWEVMRDDFIKLDTVTNSSRFVNQTIKDWIAGMDQNQREQFVGALFEILSATNARTLPQLTSGWFKNSRILIQSLKNIDEPNKQLLSQTISALFQAARKNFPEAILKSAEKNS